jgi:phosphate-selective porin OprO/OprP
MNRKTTLFAVTVTLAFGLCGAGSEAADQDDPRLAEILRRLHERMKSMDEEIRSLRARLDEAEGRPAVAPPRPEVEPPAALDVFWRDRLHFESRDGNFHTSIGGLIQNDWAFMTQEDDLSDHYRCGTHRIGGFPDGTEFRRARLRVAGVVYRRFEFEAEYDFAGGDSNFKDVYLGVRDLPYAGGIRVGHFREPFTLEFAQHPARIRFLERALPVTTFDPMRNTGVMLHSSELEERLFWAVGVFHDTDTFGDGVNDRGGGEYDIACRAWGLPFLNDRDDVVVVGAAYVYRRPENDEVHYVTRPEAHLAPLVAGTGPFEATRAHLVNVQGAVSLGPAWVQSEYVHSFVHRPRDKDAQFSGAYVSAGVFLTGEHRYVTNGQFGRVRPRRNFLDGRGGAGAWEVAARYSYVGLNDAGLKGGDLRDATVGVNWYLNPAVRVMSNYVFSHLRGVGDAHIAQFRFQVDF